MIRSETRSETCLAVRQAKITFGRIKYKLGLGGTEFRCGAVRCGCRLHGYCCWVCDCVYYVAGCGLILVQVTIISPLWLRGNKVAFGMHDSCSCLCLIRVEVAKLAKAGFRDFLADTRVGKLRRESDNNKEVYLLIQFLQCRTRWILLWLLNLLKGKETVRINMKRHNIRGL
jgi:hypothetical protein